MGTEPRFLLLLAPSKILLCNTPHSKKKKTNLQRLSLPIVLRSLRKTSHCHYVGQVPVTPVYLGQLMCVLKLVLMSNPQN